MAVPFFREGIKRQYVSLGEPDGLQQNNMDLRRVRQRGLRLALRKTSQLQLIFTAHEISLHQTHGIIQTNDAA
jgi:hypothetical protein